MTILKIDENKEYDDKTLKHLKKVELEMLKDFITICNENNLFYAIHAGTALGAVRHGGFIPWDDEIDVIMPREDYEKFLEIFKNEDDKYYLCNWHSDLDVDNNYYTPKTLFCLKNTNISYPFANWGIYIDINVLDNIPSKKNKRKIFIKKIRYLYYLNWVMGFIKSDIYPSRRKEIIGHCIKFLCELFHFNPSNFISKVFTKNIKKYYKKGNCVLDMSLIYEKPMHKKYFEENIKIKFEDINVNIPKEYDYILRSFYGDYMKLPPKNERRTHCWGPVDFGEY